MRDLNIRTRMIAYKTTLPLVDFLVQICNYIDVLAFVKFLHLNMLWIQALRNTFVFHVAILIKSLHGYIFEIMQASWLI